MARKSNAENPHQSRIDWMAVKTTTEPVVEELPAASVVPVQNLESIVQRLPWNFTSTFPQPTDEAIENGILDDEDREPENLKSLYQSYREQCLSILVAYDKIMEARRKSIDPTTGYKPRTHAGRERLRKYLHDEPARLNFALESLIGSYTDGFGQEAGDAFRKAISAWHAGIEVALECDKPTTEPNVRAKRAVRVSSCLPVPKPLRSSVPAGVFGHDERGKPIRPSAAEVRKITERVAERMSGVSDAELLKTLQRYGDDFGSKEAAQLEQYVRRLQRSR